MELKLKYSMDDVEKLTKELGDAIHEAEEDYKRKKEAKGEKVDYMKMINAVNQRKKLKILCKRLLAANFNIGNILDKPAINRASEQLEREANTLSQDSKKEVGKSEDKIN